MSLRVAAALSALLVLPVATAAPAAAADDAPVVFAAASMKTALETAGEAFAAETGRSVTFSFAASGALAKQIEAGAPAAAFVSADLAWMDWLAERDLIRPESRFDLAANALVVVAPAGSTAAPDLADPASLAAALGTDGRLAMGEPASVPAGRYGETALVALGLMDGVRDRLALVENVRVALALVARGEAPLGIVYATDAAAEPGVTVVATFPEGSHEPIVYPAALTADADASGDADAFLDFLRSDRGRGILAGLGFRPAPSGS